MVFCCIAIVGIAIIYFCVLWLRQILSGPRADGLVSSLPVPPRALTGKGALPVYGHTALFMNHAGDMVLDQSFDPDRRQIRWFPNWSFWGCNRKLGDCFSVFIWGQWRVAVKGPENAKRLLESQELLDSWPWTPPTTLLGRSCFGFLEKEEREALRRLIGRCLGHNQVQKYANDFAVAAELCLNEIIARHLKKSVAQRRLKSKQRQQLVHSKQKNLNDSLSDDHMDACNSSFRSENRLETNSAASSLGSRSRKQEQTTTIHDSDVQSSSEDYQEDDDHLDDMFLSGKKDEPRVYKLKWSALRSYTLDLMNGPVLNLDLWRNHDHAQNHVRAENSSKRHHYENSSHEFTKSIMAITKKDASQTSSLGESSTSSSANSNSAPIVNSSSQNRSRTRKKSANVPHREQMLLWMERMKNGVDVIKITFGPEWMYIWLLNEYGRALNARMKLEAIFQAHVAKIATSVPNIVHREGHTERDVTTQPFPILAAHKNRLRQVEGLWGDATIIPLFDDSTPLKQANRRRSRSAPNVYHSDSSDEDVDQSFLDEERLEDLNIQAERLYRQQQQEYATALKELDLVMPLPSSHPEIEGRVSTLGGVEPVLPTFSSRCHCDSTPNLLVKIEKIKVEKENAYQQDTTAQKSDGYLHIAKTADELQGNVANGTHSANGCEAHVSWVAAQGEESSNDQSCKNRSTGFHHHVAEARPLELMADSYLDAYHRGSDNCDRLMTIFDRDGSNVMILPSSSSSSSSSKNSRKPTGFHSLPDVGEENGGGVPSPQSSLSSSNTNRLSRIFRPAMCSSAMNEEDGDGILITKSSSSLSLSRKRQKPTHHNPILSEMSSSPKDDLNPNLQLEMDSILETTNQTLRPSQSQVLQGSPLQLNCVHSVFDDEGHGKAHAKSGATGPIKPHFSSVANLAEESNRSLASPVEADDTTSTTSTIQMLEEMERGSGYDCNYDRSEEKQQEEMLPDEPVDKKQLQHFSQCSAFFYGKERQRLSTDPMVAVVANSIKRGSNGLSSHQDNGFNIQRNCPRSAAFGNGAETAATPGTPNISSIPNTSSNPFFAKSSNNDQHKIPHRHRPNLRMMPVLERIMRQHDLAGNGISLAVATELSLLIWMMMDAGNAWTAMALSLLSTDHEACILVQEELDALEHEYGRHNLYTPDALNRMKFLDGLIYEAIRLCPPNLGGMKKTSETVEMTTEGVQIPKDTNMFFCRPTDLNFDIRGAIGKKPENLGRRYPSVELHGFLPLHGLEVPLMVLQSKTFLISLLLKFTPSLSLRKNFIRRVGATVRHSFSSLKRRRGNDAMVDLEANHCSAPLEEHSRVEHQFSDSVPVDEAPASGDVSQREAMMMFSKTPFPEPRRVIHLHPRNLG